MPSARYSPTMPIIASLVISLLVAPTALAQEAQRDGAQPAKIIHKPGDAFPAFATKVVEPAYPPLLGVTGFVLVELIIDEEGNVTSVRAIEGHPSLKEAALTAARSWQFAPTTLSGVPVKVIGTITFNFNLDPSKEIRIVKEQLLAEPNSAQLHQKLGELFTSDKQPEKAIIELNQALDLGGDSSRALFALGEAYLSARRFGQAIDAYKRVLSTNSLAGFEEMIDMRLGESYLSQELNEDALEVFKRVAANKPESPSAHYKLGLTYLKIGDEQSATSEYTILKDLNVHLADALYRLLEKQN